MTGEMETPEGLEADAKLRAAARQVLGPILDSLRQAFHEVGFDVADAAILVVHEFEGLRLPIVIATNRGRVARHLRSYADAVLAEEPHDRGRE